MKKTLSILIMISYAMLSFSISDITIGGILFTDANNDACYDVSSKAHLIALSLYPLELESRAFEQTVDIIFNPDPTKEDWNNDGIADGADTKGFTPIKMKYHFVNGSYNKKTTLILFDGNHHIIKNLYINRPTENNVGLFSNLANRVNDRFTTLDEYMSAKSDANLLSNINIIDCNINGNNNVGAILGEGERIIIRECQITGSITGNSAVGGIAGIIQVSYIINSYSNAYIKGIEKVGGIAGVSISTYTTNSKPHTCKIESCLIKSVVIGNEHTGSIIGLCDYSHVSSCISTGYTSNGGGDGKSYMYVNFPASTQFKNCFYDIQTTSIKSYNESFFEEIPLLSEEFTHTNLPLAYGSNKYNPWTNPSKGRPFLFFQKASVDNSMIDKFNHIIGNVNTNPKYDINIIKTGAKYSLILNTPVWVEVLFDYTNTIDGYIPNLENDNDYYIQPFAEDENGIRYYGDIIKKQNKKVVLHANNSTLKNNESLVPINSFIYPSFNTFKSPGYSISEWNTLSQGNNGTSYFSGDKVLISEDVTHLYARWKLSTHSLTYNKNTGVGSMPEQQFNYNQTVTILTNTFQKEGCKLAEWNTKADGSGIALNTQHTFLMPDSSITLYAQWEIDGHELSFYPNGGQGSIDPLLLGIGADTILPPNSFTKADYDFTGWNSSADGLGLNFSDTAKITMGNSDISLYAQWKLNRHNILFYSNGGQGSLETMILRVDTDSRLSPNTFSKSGYEFIGWNTSADGLGLNFADKVEVTMGDHDIKLYAQWSANNYSINFGANGGVGYMVPQEVTYGEEITLSTNTFVREGYTFKDWNTGVNGFGDRYPDGNLITPGIGNIDLYAQWSTIPYTITYKNTEGVPNVNPNSYTTTTPTLVLSHVVQHNKAFDGWFNDSLYTFQVLEIPQGSTGDRTLYAKWTNEYNLVYFSNGGNGNTQIESLTVIGANYTTKANLFTRTGYEFAGWNNQPDGTGTSYEEDQEIVLEDNIDFVLYAIWQPLEYVIAYYNAEGKGNNNTNSYTPETPTFVFSDLIRDGYTFNGWFSDSLLTNEITFMPKGSVGDTSIYAQIDINYYDLIYYSNGGNGYSLKQQLPYLADTILLDKPFSKKGYRFLGWNTSPSGNDAYYSNQSEIIGIENDLTLYAQWEIEEYSITYHDLLSAININPNKYSLYTPTQVLNRLSLDGYTFKGWFLDAEHTLAIAQVELGDTGNVNLYAHWTTNQYLINYQENGGNGNMFSQTISFGNDTVLAKINYTRKGYQFTHWNNQIDNSGISYSDNQRIMMSNENLTLYAQWRLNEYSIVYHNLLGSVNTNLRLYNVNTSSELKALDKEGYTFEGWYTDELFNNRVTVIQSGDTGKLELFAKWKINSYSIDYYGNDGMGIEPQMTILYNSDTTTAINHFTCKGYDFSHWNTQGDNTGESYQERGVIHINNENIALYAQWVLCSYNINYDNHLSVPNTNPSNYEYGSSIELSPLFNDSCLFNGWFLDEDFLAEHSQISPNDTGDLTLYAHWETKQFNVSISAGTGGYIAFENKQSNSLTSLIEYGESVNNITAHNDDGMVFISWSDGNRDNPRSLAYITSDTSITAQWFEQVYIKTADTIKTYNGKAQEPRIILSKEAKYTIKYKESNGDFWYNRPPIYAGHYDLWIKVTEDDFQGEYYGGFIIQKEKAFMTANENQTKTYGEEDPDTLQFSISGLIEGDYTIGLLSRDEGEFPGYYPINEGSIEIMTPDNINSNVIPNNTNQNYNIVFSDQSFFIDSKIEILCKWEYMLIVNNENDEFASYQWYQDGVAIAGATDQYYYNDEHTLCGVYQCEVSYIGSFLKVLTEPVTYEHCTTGQSRSLSIYPNPVEADRRFSIELPSDLKHESLDVRLYSQNGSLLGSHFSFENDKLLLQAPSMVGLYKVIVISDNTTQVSNTILVR